jgi:PAS domain-containing protein
VVDVLIVPEKIARAVFGLLFESSGEAAFVVDLRTQRIVAANVRASDMLAREPGSLVGMALGELSCEPERDLLAQGHYEEVALRRGDDYPLYVAMEVAHVETTEHGPLAACMARDMSERRLLESELLAKHSALFAAHAELEKAHAQLTETKGELERRNHEIAMLAWRATMGEVVAGIAHHLNNPVGALASTVRRLESVAHRVPAELRGEQLRLLGRVAQISRRIESNVAAIVEAIRVNAIDDANGLPELPPELADRLALFAGRLDDIPSKDPS